jgi:hypothetical protein
VQVVLVFLGRFLGRIIVSAIVVFLVLFVAAKTPMLDPEGPLPWLDDTSPEISELGPSMLDSLAMSPMQTLDGSVIGLDGAGFDMTEVVVDGVCEDAGRRYIRTQCPDCLIMEGQTAINEPGVLIWSSDLAAATEFNAIFQDCSEQQGDRVIVPMVTLSGSSSALNLGQNPAVTAGRVAPVPLPFSGVQVSAFKLGNWHVVEQSLQGEQDVMARTQQHLVDQGWRLPRGQATQADPEQLTFVSGQGDILVVTLREQVASTSLITLLHQGGESSP